MKKLLVTCAVFLGASMLQALPIQNPADPILLLPCEAPTSRVALKGGFYGDYVFRRNLQIDGGTGGMMNKTTLNTNAALVALNFMHKVDVFGTLGASTMALSATTHELNTGSILNNDPTTPMDFVISPGFSWSVGVKGEIFKWRQLLLGAEGQFFSYRSHLRSVAVDDQQFIYMDSPTKYLEWQAGFALAAKFGNWVPYMGLKFSGCHLDFGRVIVNQVGGFGPFTLLSMQNRKLVGYAVGLTLSECRRISFNIEGRFADETALHLNAQLRF